MRKRQAEGERFPFDLDELVPSVYSRKDKAVAALTRKFTQGVDYNGSPTRGSDNNPTPEVKYHLTTATFEYMVAKKNRAIFEVYRQVFHAVADAVERGKTKGLKFLTGEWEAAKKLAASAGIEGGFVTGADSPQGGNPFKINDAFDAFDVPSMCLR